MNFWGLLLSGIQAGIDFLINWLFGGEAGRHSAMGLASVIGYNAYVILEVSYAMLGNFDLSFAAVTLSVSLGAWITRLLVQLYLFIKKLIPVVG